MLYAEHPLCPKFDEWAMQGEQMLELSSGLAPASLPNVARRSVVGILAYISSPAPCQLVWNGVDLSRSGSRQVFWPIRFDLQLKTHASIGYGGTPLPACLAVSKVLLVERVAHFVPFSRPIAAAGGDRAGMFYACERELFAKLVHRARQARWGLNVTLAETVEELFCDDFS